MDYFLMDNDERIKLAERETRLTIKGINVEPIAEPKRLWWNGSITGYLSK